MSKIKKFFSRKKEEAAAFKVVFIKHQFKNQFKNKYTYSSSSRVARWALVIS